jgi:hypothetical protein
VSGQAPPAGLQWLRGLQPLEPHALAYDKPLCASLDGFTLHAATRAGALDPEGREALLRYVLRPPVAQERLVRLPDGLVRITLKRAYADGTVAVDMDPAVAAVPAGDQRAAPAVPHREVRGCARAREQVESAPRADAARRPGRVGRRTHATAAGQRIPPMGGVVGAHVRSGRPHLPPLPRTDEAARDGHRPRQRRALPRREEEATEVPRRSPGRGPPYWKTLILRRKALGDEDGWSGDDST